MYTIVYNYIHRVYTVLLNVLKDQRRSIPSQTINSVHCRLSLTVNGGSCHITTPRTTYSSVDQVYVSEGSVVTESLRRLGRPTLNLCLV